MLKSLYQRRFVLPVPDYISIEQKQSIIDHQLKIYGLLPLKDNSRSYRTQLIHYFAFWHPFAWTKNVSVKIIQKEIYFTVNHLPLQLANTIGAFFILFLSERIENMAIVAVLFLFVPREIFLMMQSSIFKQTVKKIKIANK